MKKDAKPSFRSVLRVLIIVIPSVFIYYRALAQESTLTFAIIGDYGYGDANETSVADLVKSWDPAFIITTGDDYYYPAGGSADSEKYDISTGRDYCPFLAQITTTGSYCPQPGPLIVNRFFPSLGNHDYSDSGTTDNLPTTYTDYFTLPGNGVAGSGTSGNERYYDYIQGPVHFFVINSNPGSGQEPDGISSSSIQAQWLQAQLTESTSSWNIVYFHHPPYSSGPHGSNAFMQWPFAQWGANVVIAGHDHLYEHILRDGIAYFVNGTGGAPLYPCGAAVEGSRFCRSAFGAQRVTATETGLIFEFITLDNVISDSYSVVLFSDVPSDYWAYSWIERLYNAGITGGCATSPLRYCPDDSVTRAQMAVFLERGIHAASFTPPNVAPTFTDTVGHWAEDWIEALKSDGITGGCGPGIYCPEASTTRAEMAVFLLRSKYGSAYTPPAATGDFSDVPLSYWAASWIEQLAAEGITGGCGTGIYCPDSPVTRAQMAVFLVRTFNLP